MGHISVLSRVRGGQFSQSYHYNLTFVKDGIAELYAGDTKRASDVEESDSIREGRRDPPFMQRNSGIFAIEKRSNGTILNEDRGK